MSNILSEIEQSLVRYAEMIWKITDSVVSIIDSDMVRLLYVGGGWRKDVGENCADVAHIAQAALETGKSQIMLEPAGHPGCKKCTYREHCQEKVEMWTPIIANRETLGMLGFVAETKESEEKILADPQTYLEFLEKIADLISYEALHFIEQQRDKTLITLLDSIFERLESGVIVLDKNQKISLINRMGKFHLREKFYDPESSPLKIRPTGNTIGHFKEYELMQHQETLLVAGNIHQLGLDEYTTVLIFNDARKLLASQRKISAFHSIGGTSMAMQRIRNKIKLAANSPSSVLIQGEDGLDRELYAQAIHDESERQDKPFVVIDCSTLPVDNPEKFLFGTAPATSSPGSHGKAGRIEAASGGTLVLSNIENLTPETQHQLAQLIETKRLVRSGSRKYKNINLRIIATTNKDLRSMSSDGAFSSNLYYLISVIPITIPPLRSRREDIRPLSAMYIDNYARQLNKTIRTIEDDFWHIVENYDWPGNIQELKNAMESSVNMMMHADTMKGSFLPEQIHPVLDNQISARVTLEEMEKEYISRTLHSYGKSGYSREQIAQILGIGPATLYRK